MGCEVRRPTFIAIAPLARIFPYTKEEEEREKGASRDRCIVKLESDEMAVKIKPENLRAARK